MRSNLFWLSDEQWGSIQPLLPMDVRGKARLDDRRVISVFVSTAAAGGAFVRQNMASEDNIQSVCPLGGTRSMGYCPQRGPRAALQGIHSP